MRKKTALRTPQQRETSVRKPGGLIGRGENAQDSATAKSALTNRSHRTHIRLLVIGFLAPSHRSLRRHRLMRIPFISSATAAISVKPRFRDHFATLRGLQPKTDRSLRRTPLRPRTQPAGYSVSTGLRTPNPPRFSTWV